MLNKINYETRTEGALRSIIALSPAGISLSGFDTEIHPRRPPKRHALLPVEALNVYIYYKRQGVRGKLS